MTARNTSPTTKSTKWPTYLALTADLIIDEPISLDFNHTFDATFFDLFDKTHKGTIGMWARTCPEEGMYIANNIPLSTNPIRLDVPDQRNLRLIPEQFDGSVGGQPVLPSSQPSVHGVGVMKQVDGDKRTGIITGFTFLNKNEGSLAYQLALEFEESPKYDNWVLNGVKALVAFEAVIVGIGEDQILKATVRNLAYLMDAPRPLLQALNIGVGSPGKFAKIQQARSSASKRKATDDTEPPVASGSGTTTPPPHTTEASETAAPPSPTPGLLTRGKQQRVSK
ncbi:hypothetical protein CF319_g8948 [Tilletia indica]|uniref:Uncharacterized protein n=1 Tax=Tilletia indica TaxID=43049 RepID=A0A177T7Y5_9BASI|nr:hypothetical protein CF319_g8948 [Tilletia indica]KAE8217999.1 hypothetical protein CF326_g9278 [Tilletia indica]KAE8237850.1 hypothetical protein A4X13_0g8616 [Tilletia indica]